MKWKTEKYNFILAGLFVLMAGLNRGMESYQREKTVISTWELRYMI